MKILELDHVALHVGDLAASCKFYQEILRLETLPRPAFDFPGAWFRLGAHQELHLIGERGQPVPSQPQLTHFALAADNLDDWQNHFQKAAFTRFHRKQRPDGAGQMFLEDPDGHVIELCAKKHAIKRIA